MPHKWEMPASCPVARILVTSVAENPQPWFLVANPGRIREEFVTELIEMLFGRRPDGQPHTWVKSLAIFESKGN